MRPVVAKAFRALPGSCRGTEDRDNIQGHWSRVVRFEWLGKISFISTATMATRRASTPIHQEAQFAASPRLEKGGGTESLTQWQIPMEVISRIWSDDDGYRNDGQSSNDIFSGLDASIWPARPAPSVHRDRARNVAVL